MEKQKINEAVKNAKRLIELAEDYIAETSKTYGTGEYIFNHSAPKQSGALRRCSMDLTRSLAEMRKP